jgi:hypothetical protein
MSATGWLKLNDIARTLSMGAEQPTAHGVAPTLRKLRNNVVLLARRP